MATGADIAQALSTLAGALGAQQPAANPATNSQSQPQAVVPPLQSQPVVNQPPRFPGPGHGLSPASILPSYLRRNQTGGNKPKKAKTIQTWDRDIICLPQSRRNYAANSSSYSYPRGRYRASLGNMGLIGKLHLSSDMNEDDVKKEVCSVFKGPMGNDPNFPFVFLQAAGEGSKTLVIPSVSSTYRWTAQQVARLSGQKGTIYILAQADMPVLKFDDGDGVEEELEHPLNEPPINPLHDENAPIDCPLPPVLPAVNSPVGRTSPAVNRRPPPALSATSNSNSALSPDPYTQYVNLIDLTNDSDESDTDDHILPIVNVKSQSSQPKSDLIEIKHLLVQHRDRILGGRDVEDYQRINIRRSFLLKDALRQMSKPLFDANKLLRVVFIGESAVDEGGPRREFFHLLLREIFNHSGLFAGYPNNVVPLHNVQAVENSKFYVVGKIIAMTLVQGGEAPSCFSKAIADYLINQRISSPVDICDIPDHEIQRSLNALSGASSDDQVKTCFENYDFDFLFMCGYSKATSQVKLADVNQLVATVWLHFVKFHPQAELEQLREGLCETLSFKSLISMYPDSLWKLLASSNSFDVTPAFILDSFVIQYSHEGSNNRIREEAIVIYWFEYVSDCQDRKIVTLEQILQFFSGASRIPAAGFDITPKICFTNEDDRLPWASTCELSITFPRAMGLLSEDEFKQKMDMCILGSYGFGAV